MESVLYKENSWIGKHSALPPSLLPIILICTTIILIIIILLLFSNYSQRVIVKGKIIYHPSAIEININNNGIIETKNIKQGSLVKKGDVIAILTHDISFSGEITNKKIIAFSKNKILELNKRASELEKEYEDEEKNLHENIIYKDKEILAIHSAKKNELSRNFHLKERMNFYKKSQEKGITTIKESIERENEYFNSKIQLSNFQINIERVNSEKLQLIYDVNKVKSQKKQLMIDIQQQKTYLQQQIINSTAGLESIIISPIEGVISSLNVGNGQRVTTNTIIAVIVPKSATPLMEIFIPPSVQQYVEVGQPVIMRVESLPWKWFGKISGEVVSLSTTPNTLSKNEIFFRVLVIPDKNSPYLPVGVTVEADILTVQRRIWEWLFVPLKHSIHRIIDRN